MHEGDDDAAWAESRHDGEEHEDEIDENAKSELELLRCCGIARPVGKDTSVLVKPAMDGEGLVTVHDYLSVVHPWLMGLRGDILAALGTLNGDDELLADDTELMINHNGLDELMITMRMEWIRRQKGEPPHMESNG